MKRCSECNATKALTEFHKRAKSPDGRQGLCKTCRSKLDKTPQHLLRRRQYNRTPKAKEMRRRYDASPAGKAAQTKTRRKRMVEHPDKYRANYMVSNAIKYGAMKPASAFKCVKCGKQAEEYHHHRGYAKEHTFDVIPLCRPCHNAEHPPKFGPRR